jgi:hypothetical protein
LAGFAEGLEAHGRFGFMGCRLIVETV